MGIVWLASYPKSGNTWVRFLLANYLAGPVSSTAQVEAIAPGLDEDVDIDAVLARQNPCPIKTHYPWSDKHPFAAQTDKAVVVVRHPKDVLLSNLNYQRLIAVPGQSFSDEQYARGFINVGGDPVWLWRSGYGTLDEHTASWLDNPAAPAHLLIKYEDLKAQPAEELRRIVGFMGLHLDEGRLAMAVGESSFDKMRAMEVREKAQRKSSDIFPGPAPRPGKAPRFFMNAGKSGGTLASIGPGLDEAFDRRFGALMQRLGY